MDLKSAQWICMWICVCIYSVRAACDDRGWFGSQCQYKCHCQNKRCDTNGFCDNGVKCERGWFGPRCQYQDLTVTPNAQFTPQELKSVLSDGDDSTCNQVPTVNSVSVELQNVSWITWIRLSYNDSDSETTNLFEINLEFKEQGTDASTVKCSDRIKYVDKENNIIDIKCDLKAEIAYINISGEVVGSLCSNYISGGRNIALKQSAKQSSTYNSDTSRASNAVDGNTSGNFYDNSCTHTAEGDINPHWNLTFSRPQFILRYLLYNKHVCEDNTFGLDCNTTCKCADRTEQCFVATGGCASGCASGYQGQGCEQKCQLNTWGKDCLNSCPVNCNNSRCHHVTGDCEVGCHSGFTGPDCSQAPCSDGKWGENCLNSCSEHCLVPRSCHRDNGTCTGGCKEGYTGPKCLTDICTDDLLKGVGIGAGASIGFVLFIVSAVFIFKLYRVRKRKALGDYNVPSRRHTDYPYELPLTETSAPANVKREEGVYETINS